MLLTLFRYIKIKQFVSLIWWISNRFPQIGSQKSNNTKVLVDEISQYMTRRLKLGQHCEWGRVTGTVGESPFGIPVNLHISGKRTLLLAVWARRYISRGRALERTALCFPPEQPPVLFELACLDNNVQIGGHPWHVIYTPKLRKHKGTYHICSLDDGSLVTCTCTASRCLTQSTTSGLFSLLAFL